MTQSFTMWGAGLACALGAALAGTALGSTPIADRGLIDTFYQGHETAYPEEPEHRPPDHYPLVTARGTVPVEELSERGLFSQARYRAVFADAGYDAAAYAEIAYEPMPDEPRFAERDESAGIGEPVPQAAPAQTPPTLAIAAANATSGHAKIIDVQAALAMQ